MLPVFSITTDAYDYNAFIGPRLDDFRAAGFRHIHWCERWAEDYLYSDDETARIGAALAERDMVFVDTHNAHCATARIDDPDPAVRAGGMRLLRNRIAFTKTLGGDVVVVHPPKGDEDPDERFPIYSRSLREIEPACREAGIRLAVENMASLRGPHRYALDHLFEAFEPDFLGFCFDSGHANMAGNLDLLDRHGERLIALHLHDNHGEADEHALPGDGTVDWPYVVATLRRLAYAKPINLEVALRSRPDLTGPAFVRLAHERLSDLFA